MMIIDTAVMVDYLQNNWGAFLAGAVVTRPVLCADITVKIVMNTPLKRLLTKRTRATINEWIDTFQAQVNKKADEADVQDELPPTAKPLPPIPGQ